MKALVIADGDVPARAALDAAWPGWADGVSLVVAADGGAVAAADLGVAIDLLVGDMDSLDPARLRDFAAAGVELVVVRSEKDESDMELAFLAAIDRGASELVVLGAFGGPRLDHTLANIGLLAMPVLAGRRVTLLDDRCRVSALVALGPGGVPVTCSLVGRVGDLVSLLPLGADATGVATEGLRYPLAGEALRAGPARGLSNIRVAPEARVTLGRGLLVIVETTEPD